MSGEQLPEISRRRFIVSTGLAAVALGVSPSYVWAASQKLVEKARQSGVTA
jgi:hypothetical protein